MTQTLPWAMPLPIILGTGVLILSACAPSKFAIERSPELEKYHIRTIAVVPFDAIETPQVTEPRDAEFLVPGGIKRSDISLGKPEVTSKLDYPTAGVPSYAAEKITRMIYGRMQNWRGIRVVPLDDAAIALKSVGKTKELPAVPLAEQLTAQLKVDAVLLGKVLVYRERGGSKFGGDPATVGFELKLVAADGRVLWVGNYYEQQRPMNEDIVGFWQRGGVFVTAETLAEYGVEHLLREFPYGGPG